MTEIGWIDDILHDVLDENDLAHLELILPHLSEVIAKESERLANEELQKQRAEFLEDLKLAEEGVYLWKGSPIFGPTDYKIILEKWEGRNENYS